MADNTADEYCRPLVGTELVSADRLDYSWVVRFGAGITVATESAWRLVANGRILITSEDHGHQFGLPEPVDAVAILVSAVRGRAVTAAGIDESSGDLRVDFGERLQLQFLQTSAGYESWRLCANDGETICAGGGEIVHWPK